MIHVVQYQQSTSKHSLPIIKSFSCHIAFNLIIACKKSWGLWKEYNCTQEQVQTFYLRATLGFELKQWTSLGLGDKWIVCINYYKFMWKTNCVYWNHL